MPDRIAWVASGPGTIRTPGRGSADRDARVRGGPLGRAMAYAARRTEAPMSFEVDVTFGTPPPPPPPPPAPPSDLRSAAAATTAADDELAAGSDRHAAASSPAAPTSARPGMPPPPPPPPPGSSGTGTYVPDPAISEGALRVGGEIKPPTKIKNVNAGVPAGRQEQKVQGVVILEARIEPDGTVSRTRVLRSIPMLDDAAKEAVGQWKFTPTLLNGQADPAGDDGDGELHAAVIDKSQSQAPTSKLQRTPNRQLPSQLPTGSWAWKSAGFRKLVWDLEVGSALGFPSWSLGINFVHSRARPTPERARRSPPPPSPCPAPTPTPAASGSCARRRRDSASADP